MSLPLDFPFVSTGDREGLLNTWRLVGFDDGNTDRGRLWVSTLASGSNLTVNVYKNRERTLLVATGTGPTKARITLPVSNSSGLTGSVFAEAVQATAGIILHVSVVSDKDWEERDERIRGLLPEEPTAEDFTDIWRQVMGQLYRMIQAIYPPPVFVGDPLRFPGTASVQEQGSRGMPEAYAIDLWSLNNEKDWELKGLQNPRDFSEWGINYGLYLIWNRKVRSGDDAIFTRAQFYLEESARQWDMIPVNVDTDRDGIPERKVRIRSMTLRRG